MFDRVAVPDEAAIPKNWEPLAQAMARGEDLGKAATEDEAVREAYSGWSATPAFLYRVYQIRRGMLDVATGVLVQHAGEVAAVTANLAVCAANESVRLRAAQKYFRETANLINAINFDDRLTALERLAAESCRTAGD